MGHCRRHLISEPPKSFSAPCASNGSRDSDGAKNRDVAQLVSEKRKMKLRNEPSELPQKQADPISVKSEHGRLEIGATILDHPSRGLIK